MTQYVKYSTIFKYIENTGSRVIKCKTKPHENFEILIENQIGELFYFIFFNPLELFFELLKIDAELCRKKPNFKIYEIKTESGSYLFKDAREIKEVAKELAKKQQKELLNSADYKKCLDFIFPNTKYSIKKTQNKKKISLLYKNSYSVLDLLPVFTP